MSNLYPGNKVSPLEATRKLEEQARQILARAKRKGQKRGSKASG